LQSLDSRRHFLIAGKDKRALKQADNKSNNKDKNECVLTFHRAGKAERKCDIHWAMHIHEYLNNYPASELLTPLLSD